MLGTAVSRGSHGEDRFTWDSGVLGGGQGSPTAPALTQDSSLLDPVLRPPSALTPAIVTHFLAGR